MLSSPSAPSTLSMQCTTRFVQSRGRRLGSSAALALGAAAGLAVTSVQALAQDCTLSVHASPSVVYTVQSASVDVLAHFPSNMYAFASERCDVHATLPMWSFASSGVSAGPGVLGMSVSQSHTPQSGRFANPVNPYRVWRVGSMPGGGSAAAGPGRGTAHREGQ